MPCKQPYGRPKGQGHIEPHHLMYCAGRIESRQKGGFVEIIDAPADQEKYIN
jgi:hypothetical protein